MAKKLIKLAPNARDVLNRAPHALGPGVLRLAHDDGADEADVYIYGDIGGWWGGVDAAEFSKEIAALDVSTLNVRLNSPGGLVFDGVAIYNALARHSAKTVVHIDGLAASIASVIAMAGDEIRISEGASVMIHKPWSMAIGNADVLRQEADVLDELEEGLVDIYEARTSQKRADLVDWISAESWFRGQKAVDKGFADVMVPAKKKDTNAHARSALLPLFSNTPEDLRAAFASTGGPDIREFERLLRDGEGLSHAQAKRVAALARAVQAPRDVEPEPALRDEGASHLMRLARGISR